MIYKLLFALNSCIILTLSTCAHCDSYAEKPINTVLKLYKDYAWEALIHEPKIETESQLMNQSRKILLNYFTQDLVELLIKDRDCVLKTHEICNLNFNPIWGSQDPEVIGVRILKTSKVENVKVNLKYLSNQNDIELVYSLKNENSIWRIDDIISNNSFSLKKSLSRK